MLNDSLRPLARAGLMAALLGGTLLTSACSRTELTALRPQFDISWSEDFGFVPGDLEASSLLFGEVTTGQVARIDVRITNPGNALLELEDIDLVTLAYDENGDLANVIELESDPEITTNAIPGELEDGAAYEFMVRFTPLYGEPLVEGLHLQVVHELNDDAPLYIPITGVGFGDPVPDIYSKPNQIDFGTVEIGQTSPDSTIAVGNAGPGSLDISTVTLDDTTNFSMSHVGLEGQSLSNTADDNGEIVVMFHPATQGEHTATIEIASNDPDEPVYAIQLVGVGDPPELGKNPVAVCEVASLGQSGQNIQVIHSCPGGNCPSATFDGSGSSDPSGLPLSYSWTFSAASGSSSTLSSSTAMQPWFEMDVGGTYSATLVVTNTNNQSSSPCTATIEAIPNENFRVELSWATAGDDLDLHLLRANPQGSPRTDGDCYYANCQSFPPDWGVAGVVDDNPALDLDDIPGTGPENINIVDPALAPYDGWYQVFVHDYPGSVFNGSQAATVNIYINGVLTQTFNFTMTGEDDDYYVAEIHWPSGQISPCNGLAGC